jgi:VanZ family protein
VIFQIAAWACVILLAVLSLLPGDEMVRTGVNGQMEHVVAYLGTSLVLARAYHTRLRLPTLAVLLTAYAGLLEIGQFWSPGRHPSIYDLAAGAAGAVSGSMMFAAFRRVAARG